MKWNVTRRDFLVSTAKIVALGLLAPASGAVAAGSAIAQEQSTTGRLSVLGKSWGFVIDTNQCIGCARCVKACKQENEVPIDHELYRTWVERYLKYDNDEVHIEAPRGGMEFKQVDAKVNKQFFVPKLCNQCEHPPCVQVCPVGATYRTDDGVVLVDRERCVGCRYCIQSCPYGARFLHPILLIADKCTWCYHRISNGLQPACVQVCPTKARKFGNLKDSASEVSKLRKKALVRYLKPDLGTKPNIAYVELDEVVK